MVLYETPINIELSTGDHADVVACFEIDAEMDTCPQSNIEYQEVATCELVSWSIGGLKLDRSQLVTALCESEVAAIETRIGDEANSETDWMLESFG
jgi:hypothetical protein